MIKRTNSIARGLVSALILGAVAPIAAHAENAGNPAAGNGIAFFLEQAGTSLQADLDAMLSLKQRALLVDATADLERLDNPEIVEADSDPASNTSGARPERCGYCRSASSH